MTPLATEGPSTAPVRAVLAFPADWPDWAWGDDDVIAAEFAAGMAEVQDYFLRETGRTFDVDVRVWHSSLTARQIGSSPGTSDGAQLDGCPFGNIPDGQGLHSTTLLRALPVETGLPYRESTEPAPTLGGPHQKWVVLALNGGGWAGGAWDGPSQSPHDTAGWAVIGDWGIRRTLTGLEDPCNVWIAGHSNFSGWRGTLLHELANAMGVVPYESDGGYINTLADHLSPQQIDNFLTRNDGFLR